MKASNQKLKFNFFIPILFLGFLFAQQVLAANAIYISQVQITGGKNNTNQDFIELFNPNSSALNLKGYRLVKRSTNATADVLIKSWTKDALVPPNSFFLWANSAFTTITVKPDAVSSATISDDNGVALRFGADNIGSLISSIAWGKTNNGFINVSTNNPAAGQSLQLKDFLSPTGGYVIAKSQPRNSAVNDLAATFSAVQVASSPPPAGQKQAISSPARPAPQAPASPASSSPNTTEVANSTSPAGQANLDQLPNPKPRETSPIKYLWLAGGALLALAGLGYWSLAKNRPK